ncbi:MAG: iron-containing alcohol dehydrogenase [Lactobacillus sp.]|nr:iron-containing alcohol dehydrogenase [Lactobacillus sp.]MCI2033937.1 iron-containing alcohol dehydrogenase [Lactobacillus sp.]
MAQYMMPTKIFFGNEAVDEIANLSFNRYFIICDPFMQKSHKVDLITKSLDAKKTPYAVFADVVPDPTIDVVTQGLAQALACQPEAIIALGGGSAIDTAKAINSLYAQSTGAAAPALIAVPTTSGTGSEVTSFAVISDPATKSKYPIIDAQLIPNYAILDPQFTLSVPASVTADTGMDVLTHTLEAYVSTGATDFTDAFAEKAMRIVWQELATTVKHGDDLAARTKMHNASCLAGLAFSSAGLGISHSLAHAFGGMFHIPHGRANAMILPHIISYNAGLELAGESTALHRYEAAANLLGIQAGTPKATVHGLITGIKRLSQSFNIPQTINDYGIDPEEFLEAVPAMAQKALDDNCTGTNPRKPSLADLEGLYKELVKGGY